MIRKYASWLFCILLSMHFLVVGMESPSLKQPQSFDCILLLDEGLEKGDGGVFASLCEVIRDQVPMIVSNSLLALLVHIKNEVQKFDPKTDDIERLPRCVQLIGIENIVRLSNNFFNSHNWLIAEHAKGDFTLAIPYGYWPMLPVTEKNLSTLDSLGLNSSVLKVITSNQSEQYFALKQPSSIDVNALQSLFLLNNTLPKYIFLNGHGLYAGELSKTEQKRSIASLDMQSYKKVLQFFNKINVQFLFVKSCFAGGFNLLAPYQQDINQQSAIPLNYFLIVSSATDTVSRQTYNQTNFQSFFAAMHAFFSDKPGKDPFSAIVKNFYGDEVINTASLRFPGSINYFKAINAINEVEIITYAKTTATLLASKGLIRKIPVDIQKIFQRVREIKIAGQQPAQEDIQVIEEYLKKSKQEQEKIAEKNRITIKKKRAVLVYPAVVPNELVFEEYKLNLPLFISMIPGHSLHIIEKITTVSNTLEELLDIFFRLNRIPELVVIIKNVQCKNYKNSYITDDEDLEIRNIVIKKNVINDLGHDSLGTVILYYGSQCYKATIKTTVSSSSTRLILKPLHFSKVDKKKIKDEINSIITDLPMAQQALTQASGGQEDVAQVKQQALQLFKIKEQPKLIQTQQQQTVENLIDAIYKKDVTKVKELITQGIDINMLNAKGELPLEVATRFWLIDIVRLLLEAGANVNAVDNQNTRALSQAAFHYSMLKDDELKKELKDIIKLLVNYGANPMIKDESGATDLDFIKKSGDKELIEFVEKKLKEEK